MNAFTGQEITAFYVRVPDRHLGLALDILSDIVWSPAFRADEVESERQVILEEIRMRDDTPDDLVHDLFAGRCSPATRSAARSPGSQDTISRDAARRRSPRTTPTHYQPDERRGRGRRQPRPRRGRRRWSTAALPEPTATPARRASTAPTPATPSRFAVVDRPLEQAHVVLGARALRRDDPDRYALAVVDQVLGGGMSSRLFQEVREKRGLAYSVFSYRSAFEETGALAVYCGTAPERVDEMLDVVDGELDRLVADGGVTERRARRGAKGHLKGSLALSLESSSSRMHRIGRSRAHAWARSRASTRWSSRSTRSPPTTSPGSSTGVLGRRADAGGGRPVRRRSSPPIRCAP